MRPSSEDFVTIGVLGKLGMAESMSAAIERGSQVNRDLSEKWDYWALCVALSLEEARRRLNIVANG
jgi:hypothetical protein